MNVHEGKVGGPFDKEALSISAARDGSHNHHTDLLKQCPNSPRDDIAIFDDEDP